MNDEYLIVEFDPLFLEGLPSSGWTINTEPLGVCPPGTVKISEPEQNPDGTWSYTFEYKPEGWAAEETDQENASKETY